MTSRRAPSAVSDPVAYLQRYVDGAHDAAVGGDLAAWRGAHATIARLTDRDVRLAGHLAAVSVLRSVGLDVRRGMLALAIAAAVLAELEREPLEPALWNLLAELLGALGWHASAGSCAAAARRLDAEAAPPSGGVRTPAAAGVAERAAALAATVRAPEVPARLSVAMIVRDEEAMLPACLQSIRSVADEVIVVDTGSVDRTVEIARDFGARVVDFPWIGDFAAARNAGLEHATGDWVLVLDADERLVEADARELRRIIAMPWLVAAHVTLINATEHDGVGLAVSASSLRLWRNSPSVHYEGRVHEQVAGLPRFLPQRFAHAAVRVLHDGYRAEHVAGKRKFDRNRDLLEQLLAEGGDRRAYNLYNLGAEHLIRGDAADALPILEESLTELERREGLAVAPWGPMLAVRLTVARRRAGDAQRAERDAARWLALFPDHTDLAVERAQCAALTDPSRGLELLEAAIALGDGPARYNAIVGVSAHVGDALRGDVLAHAGRHREAVESYRRGLAANRAYVAGAGGLAKALLRLGTAPAAVHDELAPLIRPYAAVAGGLLATAFLGAGATAEAEAVYRMMLEQDPGSPEARAGIGSCLVARGDVSGAALHFEPPVAEGPAAAPLLRGALFCALAGDDPQRACELLAEPAMQAIAAPEAELLIAWRDTLEGRRAGPLDADAARVGLKLFATAAHAGATDACGVLHALVVGSSLDAGEARDGLALRLFEAGYVEVAADEWLELLEMEASAPALLGLARVAAARGEPDDAAALVAEACRLEPALDGVAGDVDRLIGAVAA
jgi:tetratricopeptide (TPR) repeat protein